MRNSLLLVGILVLGIWGCGETDSGDSSAPLELPERLLGPITPLGLYDEAYSGYWAFGGYCSGNGFARLGLNGTVAELSPGIGSTSLLTGEADSEGNLTFEDRTVVFDCEGCRPVPPLKTEGRINFESETGYVRFEVACFAPPRGNFVVSITMQLSEGYSQPQPYTEMHRIKSEMLELIDSDKSCSERSECSTLKIDRNDSCNIDNPVYSNVAVDEGLLESLLGEYRYFRSLTGLDSGTGITLCNGTYSPSCDEGSCIKRR